MRNILMASLLFPLLLASCAAPPAYQVRPWVKDGENVAGEIAATAPGSVQGDAYVALDFSFAEAQVLNRCGGGSAASQSRSGCLAGLEQSEAIIRDQGLYYSDEQACQDKARQISVQKYDFLNAVLAWCDANSTGSYERAGCRDAASVFFASLQAGKMCVAASPQAAAQKTALSTPAQGKGVRGGSVQPQVQQERAPWERATVSSGVTSSSRPQGANLSGAGVQIKQDSPKYRSEAAVKPVSPAKVENPKAATVQGTSSASSDKTQTLKPSVGTENAPVQPVSSTKPSAPQNTAPAYVVPEKQPVLAPDAQTGQLASTPSVNDGEGVRANTQERTLTPGTSVNPAPPAGLYQGESSVSGPSAQVNDNVHISPEATASVGAASSNDNATDTQEAVGEGADSAETGEQTTQEAASISEDSSANPLLREYPAGQDWPVSGAMLELPAE